MLTPVIIGFGINYLALGAFLAAVILTGQLMANFLSNAGGAWDNAKKYIEDGHEGGKGSEAHKAAVIGDTVGDPFKDTAGPALNPLIKVMNLVSLLILPAVISLQDNDGARYAIAGVALVVLAGAIAFSKRKATPMDEVPEPRRSRPSRRNSSVEGGAWRPVPTSARRQRTERSRPSDSRPSPIAIAWITGSSQRNVAEGGSAGRRRSESGLDPRQVHGRAERWMTRRRRAAAGSARWLRRSVDRRSPALRILSSSRMTGTNETAADHAG